MWDLAEDPVSIALLESFYKSGKPIALVCHSPGVLRHVTYKGEPLVKGKHVTGFTNSAKRPAFQCGSGAGDLHARWCQTQRLGYLHLLAT